MSEFIGLLQFPVSVILAVSYTLLVWLLHYKAGKTGLVRSLAGWKAGAISMSVVAAMMAVEGTWGIDIHETVPFFIAALVLQLCLELAILERLSGKAATKKTTFIITHFGMYLIVWASFWGAPDVIKSQIPAGYNDELEIALREDGNVVALPFSIKLEDFEIDTYDDGMSPRQYTSSIIVRDKSTEETHHLKTSVNHPCSYRGYRIYQSGYDTEMGRYSVLQVVRDRWLPVVYIGMLLILIGSSIMLAGRWKLKVLVPAVLVLAVIFTAATIAKISFGTLPPALRSIWFVPHVIVYMVAYSAMAISVVLSIADLAGWKKGTSGEISDSLLRTSSVLLLVGMLCGCVWAKQAWGDYWTWDPKECWAGVTWLLTLVHIHMAPIKGKRARLLLAVLLLTFLSIQVTWYGVNYLPSASESMHTYNR